jgi:phosphoribosylaminoimidazole carboxylase PurE protein
MPAEAALDNPTGARVAIVMGSDSDLPVMRPCQDVLRELGIASRFSIVSAHRTPDTLYRFGRQAHDLGYEVLVAGAGGAAHLPGMLASLTPLPVIGVPVSATKLEGFDALLSIVQMPRGVPVATVAIDNSANAGMLAAQILGVGDLEVRARIMRYRQETAEQVRSKADRLEDGTAVSG